MQKLTYAQQIQLLAEMQTRINAIDELVLGAVVLLGREEVLQAARDFRADERRKIDEALASQVAQGVEKGWLVPAKVSGLKSLVTGEEMLPDGTKGRLQVFPNAIPPPQRGQYIGRQVGEEFEAAGPAGKFKTTITGVYEVDETRRQEVLAEAEAAKAATAAPAEPVDPAQRESLAEDAARPLAPPAEFPEPNPFV